MLNKIVLMGRLTRDPELKYTQQDIPVCTVTLAVERDFAPQGAQREADFIDVVAWRNTAEFLCKWFSKGVLIACEGRLQTRKWKDKHEQNRVSYEVVAEHIYFAERTDGERQQSTPERTSPAPPPASTVPYHERHSAVPSQKFTPPDIYPDYQQQSFDRDANYIPDDEEDEVPL